DTLTADLNTAHPGHAHPGHASRGHASRGRASRGHASRGRANPGHASRGCASLDTGERLTPAAARRLACDAQILPLVLGSPTQVLDAGRSRRLATGPLRRALILRDGGCAFPTCDRPPRWCNSHHITHWADGGPTDRDNLVLLCGHHHRLIHHDDWTVQMGADRLPQFLPPAHIDPTRRPRRNIFHQRT
ncbi:MAG TPA: HNH endonuclease signature motif containing protein, partial [Actinoplanes sp.]|nr:HNH endonuclease signature motif containing protein [Actinoplanes sp.]